MADSIEFPKAGIPFSFIINTFLPLCGGKQALKGLSTEEVCEMFIKPMTSEHKESYCDQLLRENHPAYQEYASVFISHAHKYQFLDVISALEYHLRAEQGTTIWFDLFSINQHLPMQWSFEWLSTTFRTAIGEIGRTIMVMSPWNDPIPFNRAWCIFEAFCTVVTSSRFEIALGENDRLMFLESVKVDTKGSIGNLLANIRAESSECSIEDDKEKIFSVIRSTVGFFKLDSLVFHQYRGWVLQVSEDALAACSNEGERILLLNTVGQIYMLQGKQNNAEAHFFECLQRRQDVYGKDSPEYLDSLHLLATLYAYHGRRDAARGLYEDCLERRKRILGAKHVDSLETMTGLGNLFIDMGIFWRAEPLCRECLEARKEIFGLNHTATLQSMNNVGKLLCRQGLYDDSLPILEECIERQSALLGPQHPDTLRSMSDLLMLLHRKKSFVKCEKIGVEILQVCTAVFGEDHPLTIQTLSHLIKVYSDQGKYDDAYPLHRRLKASTATKKELSTSLISILKRARLLAIRARYEEARPLYVEVLKRHRVALGNDHKNTLDTMSNLSRILFHLGEYKESESLCLECLERRKEKFGSQHAGTLNCLNDAAELYQRMGKFEEAEKYYLECIEGRTAVLGESDSKTLEALHDLGTLYDGFSDHTKARAIYQDCLQKQRAAFGEKDVETLNTLYHLAVLADNVGRRTEALSLYLECLEGRRKIFSERSPEVEQVRSHLKRLDEYQTVFTAWCFRCIPRNSKKPLDDINDAHRESVGRW